MSKQIEKFNVGYFDDQNVIFARKINEIIDVINNTESNETLFHKKYDYLKACPFCGNEVILTKDTDKEILYYIYCTNDECIFDESTKSYDLELCITLWNNRK